MGKKKLTPEIKSLILKEKKRNPLLGCRKLSLLLKDKYSLVISKSLINKVLISQGVKGKKGRKSEFPFLKIKKVDNCGLLLLKSAEADICLSQILKESIGLVFPHYSPDKLEYLIDYFTYGSVLKSLGGEGLALFSNLDKPLSAKALRHFLNKFQEEELSYLLRERFSFSLKEVHSLRIVFQNKFSIYIDPEFRSFWRGKELIPPSFSLPFIKVKEKLKKISEGEAIFIILGIPCFGKFPPAFIQLLKSLPSGVESLEVIGRRTQVLERLNIRSFDFILGFLPQEIVAKGGAQRISPFVNFKIPGLEERIYAGEFKIKSSQLIDIKEVRKRFVLIKRQRKEDFCWGIFTNTNFSLERLVKFYTLAFPYLERGLLRDLELITHFSFNKIFPFLEEKVSSFISLLNSENFFAILGEFLKDYFYHKYLLGKAKNFKNWENIFKLKGRISKKKPGFLRVFLEKAGFLQEILAFLNEADIFFRQRKILFFSL
ncbi:MAG: helix-turn-helix domain-containing protein [Candidatus Omnitrophica bacterium]|nr:helix-turn-helix domain-containing protein [Candidatus Omnitrophota bacterium]